MIQILIRTISPPNPEALQAGHVVDVRADGVPRGSEETLANGFLLVSVPEGDYAALTTDPRPKVAVAALVDGQYVETLPMEPE